MSSKKITLISLLIVVAIAFVFGMNIYQRRVQNAQESKVSQNERRLVRAHAPVTGPKDARVTIVEFFDPACETCRAFYPIVKDLMRQYPNDVRLVVRYAPFHQGSDQIVRLLEASKRQGKYWEVMEMLLAAQPSWADHGKPNLEAAYAVARQVGLNIDHALVDAKADEVSAVLKQDTDDLVALEVTKTPTFFVNGRALPSFGVDQLNRLVAEEVNKSKR